MNRNLLTLRRAKILCAVAAKLRVTGEPATRGDIARVTGIDLHRSEPLASMVDVGLLTKRPGAPTPKGGGRAYYYELGPLAFRFLPHHCQRLECNGYPLEWRPLTDISKPYHPERLVCRRCGHYVPYRSESNDLLNRP